MNWSTIALVAAGGAIGSVLRALLTTAVPSTRMPWTTIAVNVVGSFVIGWVMARLGGAPGRPNVHAFWVVGVCGGFTTFSAFSWQTVAQMQKGDWAAAMANVFLSVGLCLGATWLGWKFAQ